MKKALAILGSVALVMGVSACSLSCATRRPTRPTRAVLATRSGPIKACYDEALKADPQVGGTVAVRFTVEKKRANPDASAGCRRDDGAPAAGRLRALPAQRAQARPAAIESPGDGTFVWAFTANPPVQSPRWSSPRRAPPG
jgi:hypothetical protein